jgi:hypothetical protein
VSQMHRQIKADLEVPPATSGKCAFPPDQSTSLRDCRDALRMLPLPDSTSTWQGGHHAAPGSIRSHPTLDASTTLVGQALRDGGEISLIGRHNGAHQRSTCSMLVIALLRRTIDSAQSSSHTCRAEYTAIQTSGRITVCRAFDTAFTKSSSITARPPLGSCTAVSARQLAAARYR